MNDWIFVSVIGRDRPGIVASVSTVLYQNRCNIEDLSQTAMRGQFAMILIASTLREDALSGLQRDFQELARYLDLDINLKKIRPEELAPYDAGETEPFIITVQGEDRPGLVYGISEILAERGINITNLDARVARLGGKQEYIQLFEVDVPKGLDHSLIQDRLWKRGQEMGVAVDLQHRDIFRAINRI
ncbi:MAG: ACT domain-containing protein [Deltaproteobacteria bacterium]|nr:ACT domain-containing protein [Deltaproteobacteria bacterium]